MRSSHTLLNTAEDIQRLAKVLEQSESIALDTEFIREHTFFPIVALIQVATLEESWLIDPLALGPADLQPFFAVLENPKILKILHAAQADQECLYTNFKVVARPSFDTAVGASLCGFGESAGLSRLVKEVLGVSLQKGHARTDWTVRPLQPQLIKYAHQDVQYLIPLAKKLLTDLDKSGRREWAMELSARFEDTKMYEVNPEAIARKLVKTRNLDRRGYAVLKELIEWRENRVRELDVPRRRVADDDILVDLANVRPKDMNHLSAFRGLNKGELKNSGEAILRAIRKAMQLSEVELPQIAQVDSPSINESRMLELMQCYLKLLADQLQIAPRHLLTSDGVLALIRGRFEKPEDLAKAGILTAGAAQLVGKDLIAMTKGQRALLIRSGNIEVKELA